VTENSPFNQQLYEEAIALARLVELAARARKYGSFSERNPTAGKMVTCKFCKKRQRAIDPPCCNANVIPGTEHASAREKGRKNPRLSRNKPPLLEVHDKLLQLERSPDFQEYEGVAGVVEAAITRRKKSKAKKRRQQQKKSRKLNRRK
jgi:hypothetical protein